MSRTRRVLKRIPGARRLRDRARRLRYLRNPRTGYMVVDAADARDHAPAGDLASLFFAHEGRVIFKWPHYFAAYERHLGPWRGRPVRLLELGVWQGGSLELWRAYLGDQAAIVGVDIHPRCEGLENVRIGSQSDAVFLRSVVAELGGIDVVIDDASHRARDQRASLAALWPLLTDGGLYIIEDVHTAYWAAFGGGHRRKGSAVEVGKDLVDAMNGWYHRHRQRTWGVDAQNDLGCVAFYDGLIVLEKRVHAQPFATHVGCPARSAAGSSTSTPNNL
jgi:Methyltransferase domain